MPEKHINTTVYGTSDEWIDYLTQGDYIKVANFGDFSELVGSTSYTGNPSTLYAADFNGKMPFGTFDRSICFAGYGSTYSGGDIQLITRDTTSLNYQDTSAAADTPFFLGGGYNESSGTNNATSFRNGRYFIYNPARIGARNLGELNGYTGTYGSKSTAINRDTSTSISDSTRYNNDARVKPIVNFDFKRLRWLIAVYAIRTTNGAEPNQNGENVSINDQRTVFMDLKTYCGNVNVTYTWNNGDTWGDSGDTITDKPSIVYPYVIGVYLIPFCDTGSESGTVTSINFSMGLCDFKSYSTTINYTTASGESTNYTISGQQLIRSWQQGTTAALRYTTTNDTITNTVSTTWHMSQVMGTFAISAKSILPERVGMAATGNTYSPIGVFNIGFKDMPNVILLGDAASTNALQVLSYNAYYSGFKARCEQVAANLGMFFTDDYNAALHGNPDSEEMRLGTLNADGYGTGEFTNGAANRTQPQWDWTTPAEDSTIDPDLEPEADDPNRYIDNMGGIDNMALASFSRLYAMMPTEINNLRRAINNICLRKSDETDLDYQKRLQESFLTSNPIDCIVGLKWFPFDVASHLRMQTSEAVKISGTEMRYTVGETDFAVIGYTDAAPQTLLTIPLGYCNIYRHHQNFLDYEPFTHAEMYLPFCASVELDLKIIENRTLYVSYKIDAKTGSCTAIISLNGYNGEVYKTSHGTISVDIPVSGIQTANYQNAIYQGISNLKNAQIGLANAKFGFLSNAVKNAVQPNANSINNMIGSSTNILSASIAVKSAEYNIDSQQVPYRTVGGASAGDSLLMYPYPAVIISKPIMSPDYNAAAYGHTVGFACILTEQLTAFSGLTVATSIDTSGITATETEKNEIAALLQAGVYL